MEDVLKGLDLTPEVCRSLLGADCAAVQESAIMEGPATQTALPEADA